MTESGVFVDVNCEEHHRVALAVAVWVATSTALQVQGYLSPMDIDMMASASLCKGYEAMHVHALLRVPLGMFGRCFSEAYPCKCR